MNAMPVVRGCGTRKMGCAYAECGMSPDGRPVEDFLVCEPLLLDEDDQSARAVGRALR